MSRKDLQPPHCCIPSAFTWAAWTGTTWHKPPGPTPVSCPFCHHFPVWKPQHGVGRGFFLLFCLRFFCFCSGLKYRHPSKEGQGPLLVRTHCGEKQRKENLPGVFGAAKGQLPAGQHCLSWAPRWACDGNRHCLPSWACGGISSSAPQQNMAHGRSKCEHRAGDSRTGVLQDQRCWSSVPAAKAGVLPSQGPRIIIPSSLQTLCSGHSHSSAPLPPLGLISPVVQTHNPSYWETQLKLFAN